MGTSRNSELLSPGGIPTIEELVAAHSICTPYDSPGIIGSSTSSWPSIIYPTDQFEIDRYSPGALKQPSTEEKYAEQALTRLGALFAQLSPANLLNEAAVRIAEAAPAYSVTETEFDSSPSFSDPFNERSAQSQLRLTNPGDRLAMRPASPRGSSWCVPQTLYEQLERLSEHAYTAHWASFVGNQLRSLTERDQLEGDDVQAALADLGEAAQEALLMAENADDDRLRVELLRAHWALARRLDCWAALHEERTALRSSGRLAARGELSPYFDGGSAESASPDDVSALSKGIEIYETTRDPLLAQELVERQKALAASPASFDRALADAVEQHYRNANVRIAITAAMVNRMMGEKRTETRPVRDQIAGAFVRGQSDIQSQSRVDLAPAENQWQMKIYTNGVVESNTMANAGSVRLRSQGATDFSGSKWVVIRPDGMQLQPSDVEATSRTRLMGVTTDYDWVPIVGGYTRDRAMQEYRSRQNFVRSATESRVSTEASDTLDRETHEALERVRKDVYDRFTERFDEYGIKLTTIEMKSTPERLVARVRVASDEQLGSHTPRPRALSDSLASLQIHESALNNLAITFGLDGQRLTAEELKVKLRERFPKMREREATEAGRDAVFQFAPTNAVQCRIANGQLELRIAFDSIELDGDEMQDVVVHATYGPAINGLDADLAREGALGIEGQFSARERARLHNIFNTVFPPERRLALAHLNNDKSRNLEGLMITQLVLEDGWVGLAIGPESEQRVAERTRSLR